MQEIAPIKKQTRQCYSASQLEILNWELENGTARKKNADIATVNRNQLSWWCKGSHDKGCQKLVQQYALPGSACLGDQLNEQVLLWVARGGRSLREWEMNKEYLYLIGFKVYSTHWSCKGSSSVSIFPAQLKAGLSYKAYIALQLVTRV